MVPGECRECSPGILHPLPHAPPSHDGTFEKSHPLDMRGWEAWMLMAGSMSHLTIRAASKDFEGMALDGKARLAGKGSELALRQA